MGGNLRLGDMRFFSAILSQLHDESSYAMVHTWRRHNWLNLNGGGIKQAINY